MCVFLIYVHACEVATCWQMRFEVTLGSLICQLVLLHGLVNEMWRLQRS